MWAHHDPFQIDLPTTARNKKPPHERGRRASKDSPYRRSNSQFTWVTCTLYRLCAPCPEVRTSVNDVGLVKILLKIFVLLLVAAAIAGVVVLVKKPAAEPVSFEHWPDVPRKTAA